MKNAALPALAALCILFPTHAALADDGFQVIPFEFDPHGTHLVAAQWKEGIGCPTKAKVVPFAPPNFDTLGPPTTYSDPACLTGDPDDRRVEGLLLAKTGPTNNDASAGALIKGVEGKVLTELGYDIRKPGAESPAGPSGSHCGAGAPRFNVTLENGDFFFIGCNSPPATSIVPGEGFIRLRWGGSAGPLQGYLNGVLTTLTPGLAVKSLEIVFDEGQDAGPDFFGAAVLDNIDVNGQLKGEGPRRGNDDEDEGEGEDGDHNSFRHHGSASRPEQSSLSYQDRSSGMNVQSVGGARSISYNTPNCVSFVGDALVNGKAGYLFTFAACDLSSVLGAGIGNMTVTITGPSGFNYQKSSALTSGFVRLHR